MASARFEIAAIDRNKCWVMFEPSAIEYEMAPNDAVTVEVSSSAEAVDFELTHSPQGITVWDGANSETRAWNQAGTQIC